MPRHGVEPPLRRQTKTRQPCRQSLQAESSEEHRVAALAGRVACRVAGREAVRLFLPTLHGYPHG
jgi:hypothetical protein